MGRLGRIVAIILLAAIIISAALIFSSFAIDESAGGAVKTLYDLGSSTPSLANAPAEMTLTQQTSTNGIKYYNVAFKDGWGVEDGGYTKAPYIQIAPGRHYLKNGWRNGDTAEGEDDTDYLVMDFDISTDSNQFDQIYFQTLFYYGKETLQTDGSYKGVRTSAQSGHYALFGDSGEDAYFVASDDSTTAIPIDVQSDEEWAHITMVVDATKESERKMHLYYNGQYISSRVCMKDSAVYLESMRFCLGTTNIAPDVDNESFSIANATIKSFPHGYTGELSRESENLGNALYPLSSFSDLGYCLANLPENTIARVTHTDDTYTLVTSISELDANLAAGDTVLLYRDIPRKIVVPGVEEGESVVSAVNFELNGHTMVEPLALADYDALDWIIRKENGELHSYTENNTTVFAKGAQVYADGALSFDTLSAYINAAFPSGIVGGVKLKVSFLKDTSITYTASVKHGYCSVTYDLNGNKLNIAGGKLPFQSGESRARVIIRGGEMVNVISNPVYLSHAAVYYLVDVNLTLKNSFSDQRSGTLMFINTKIESPNTVASIKSNSGKSSNAVFDGCEIAIKGVSPVSFSNIRTSSARRGSMNNFVGIYNTVASGDSSLVHINYYANEWQEADAVALANDNKVGVSLQGSSVDISGGNAAVLASIQSLADLNNSYKFAEGFSASSTVYIDNSDISADTVVSADDAEALAILKSKGVEVGAYTGNTSISISESSIKTGSYVFSNTIGSGSENGVMAVTLHDAVMLTRKEWAAEESSLVDVLFAEGVKLAYSYDAIYPYIATVNWSESTLVGERPETTTVKLSPVFSDGVVLQANKEINIYGSCATIGAEIEVTLGDNTKKTTVGTNGKWSVALPPMDYSNGLTLYVNELGLRFPETSVTDVKIGEIWMMSGQSNSVYGTYKMEDFAEYRANADNFENIYAFAVNQGHSLVEKTESANSGWYKVNSSTLTKDDRYTGISAIAYVMATRLATELGDDVPIGIIDINFNGSTVEAWMSPENLEMVDSELNKKYLAYRSYYEKNGTYPSESDVSEYGPYIPSGKLYQKMACACYNAMIAPFFDGFVIRGAIWYQGEGNAGSVTADDKGDYATHFSGVKSTFREAFGDEELPVFIIQIPPRMNNPFYFRALQYDMAAEDKNSYLVMSLYAGSTYSSNELKYTTPASDSMVHYERRSPVGLALADSVLENIYGMGNLSAPKILSLTKVDGAIRITFDRELTVDMGSEMLGFEIAAADGDWVCARAHYENKVVTLTADGVSSPEQVRYGCAKSILVMKDGTEIVHNKSDADFVYNESAGTVTITANGRVFVIDTSDPAIIGGRMACNVVATNGTALPLFLLNAE